MGEPWWERTALFGVVGAKGVGDVGAVFIVRVVSLVA